MKKLKRKYFIFEEEHQDYGDGHLEDFSRLIGTTYAVSEAQAVNNYCYRTNRRPMEIVPWCEDGYRETWITARVTQY